MNNKGTKKNHELIPFFGRDEFLKSHLIIEIGIVSQKFFKSHLIIEIGIVSQKFLRTFWLKMCHFPMEMSKSL